MTMAKGKNKIKIRNVYTLFLFLPLFKNVTQPFQIIPRENVNNRESPTGFTPIEIFILLRLKKGVRCYPKFQYSYDEYTLYNESCLQGDSLAC